MSRSYRVMLLLLIISVVATRSLVAQGGNALSFDGSNDQVQLNSGISIGGSSFTLEAWYSLANNPSSQQYHKVFLASVGTGVGNSYQAVNFYFVDNGSGTKINTGFYGEDLSASWTYDASWHHVAFTFDQSTKQGILYLDGVSIATHTFGNGLAGSSASYIGTAAWAPNGSEHFPGKVDEVRIWNVVRTSTEIQSSRNDVALSASTSGLVAYYHCDQGTDGANNSGVTSLTDATSNNYNGTLANFALSGSSSNWVLANNTSLPVELVSFAANVRTGGVELQWSTATEVDNARFDVQRKQGTEWVLAGSVAGQGTSNVLQSYSFQDANGSVGASYRLKQIDRNGTFTYSSVVTASAAAAVTSFSLSQNSPNPFNPSTTINYSLPASGNMSLKVYNVVGQEVATLAEGFRAAGSYSATFTASHLASGVYFYRLQSAATSVVKKMMLLK